MPSRREKRRPDRWIPLDIGAYHSMTAHFTNNAQHGATLHLLMHAWKHEGLLPVDPTRLAGIARCRPGDFKRLWKTIGELWITVGITGEQAVRLGGSIALGNRYLTDQWTHASEVYGKRVSNAHAGGEAQQLRLSLESKGADRVPERLPKQEPVRLPERGAVGVGNDIDIRKALSTTTSDALSRPEAKASLVPDMRSMLIAAAQRAAESSVTAARHLCESGVITELERDVRGAEARALLSQMIASFEDTP